jgi:hypothetical protein
MKIQTMFNIRSDHPLTHKQFGDAREQYVGRPASIRWGA